MKLLSRFLSLLLFLLVLAAGVGVGQAAFRGGAVWSVWLEVAETHRYFVAAGGLAAALVAVLWALAALPRGDKNRYFAFENPGGEVRVSLDAVRDYLVRMNADFPNVVKVHPVVRSEKGELDVTIGCEVRAGCAIPDLAQQIQDRVRERIVNGIGIPAVRSIQVVVRQIVDSGRSAVAPHRETEAPPEPAAGEPEADAVGNTTDNGILSRP